MYSCHASFEHDSQSEIIVSISLSICCYLVVGRRSLQFFSFWVLFLVTVINITIEIDDITIAGILRGRNQVRHYHFVHVWTIRTKKKEKEKEEKNRKLIGTNLIYGAFISSLYSFFHSFASLATDYTILDVCSGSQIKRSIYRWIMIIPWMIRWSVSIAFHQCKTIPSDSFRFCDSTTMIHSSKFYAKNMFCFRWISFAFERLKNFFFFFSSCRLSFCRSSSP